MTATGRLPSELELPFISIVMPVRNEEHFIADTIGQLLQQDYPQELYEIIVADGFSDDATRQIVADISKTNPLVRLLDNPGRRSSSGRNVGFKNGKGDIFLVVDGHCYIPDNVLLRNTVVCLEKSGADCLGRPQPLNPPGLSLFQQAVALARGSRLGHSDESLIFGNYEGFASPVSNGATYLRHVFTKTGYVDETFDAAEDVEFNYRVEQAGFSCYTSPSLTVCYYPREDFVRLFRQMVRYGMGRSNFIRKHPQALTLNQLLPACFVLGLLVLLVSSLLSVGTKIDMSISPVIMHFSAILVGIYFIVVLIESFRITVASKWFNLVLLPGIFFTVHFGLGWGFLTQALGFARRK